VRLQAEQLEVAVHAGLGDAGLVGHGTNAPVRRAIGRLGVQGRVDQPGQTLVVNRASPARRCLAVETLDAALDELRAPLANGDRVELQSRRNRTVRSTLRTDQNEGRGALASPRPMEQEIGAAVEFLGCDGLIAPCARWDCENLMLFPDSASLAGH
jgi:hypothetical protein